LSITSFGILTDWPVPAEYKTKKNPFAGQADDGTGKKLYTLHCKSCHGAARLNDGAKAAKWKANMRALNSADVKKQTDGELYYKGIIGDKTKNMPNCETKIPVEKDRWMLVNYTKSLK
jgi:mono/diheme cytochrome c family protein